MATSDSTQDLLGRDLTTEEQALLDGYRHLTSLLDLDLAPCAAANVREAVSALWQAVNDLALTDERPSL